MGKLNFRSRKVKLVVILLVLIPIVIYVAQTDFHQVRHYLASIGGNFFYLLLVSSIAYYLGTLSWYVSLGKYKSNLSLFKLYVVRLICETISLYNPTSIVGGDLYKIEVLKNYQVPKQTAFSSVLISRFTTILSQIFLFMLGVVWLLYFHGDSSILSLIGNYIFVLLGVLFSVKLLFMVWLFRPEQLQENFGEAKKNIVYQIKSKLYEIKLHVQDHKSSFVLSYLYALLHWIIGSVEFYLILLFIGFDSSIMGGVFMDMSVIVIKSFVAFIPGQIGVEELANKFMLAAIGVQSATIWIAVSVLRRARQIFWIAIGGIFFWFIKKRSSYVSI